MTKILAVAILAVGLATAAESTKITARQAKDHVGEVQTVCGKVVSTRYAARSNGQPTFLQVNDGQPRSA